MAGRLTARKSAGGAVLKVPESKQQWLAVVWTRGGMCGSSNMQLQVIQQCGGAERNVSSIDALHCHGLARYKKPLESFRLGDHHERGHWVRGRHAWNILLGVAFHLLHRESMHPIMLLSTFEPKDCCITRRM